MHVMKLKSTDIRGVVGEARREHKSKVGDIDPARTDQNWNVLDHDKQQSIRTDREIKKRIADLGYSRKIRPDAVVAISTIIDLPRDFEGSKKDVQNFFACAYMALKDELCQGDKRRIIGAYVHMDEATPHMHFISIPMVEKDGKMKLSARDLVTKNFLKSFHPNVEKRLKQYGQQLNLPEVHLYSQEKIESREAARSRGDRSEDYVDLPQYKAIKQRQAKEEEQAKRIADQERQIAEQKKALEQTKAELDMVQAQGAMVSHELAKAKAEVKWYKGMIQKIQTVVRRIITKLEPTLEPTEHALDDPKKEAEIGLGYLRGIDKEIDRIMAEAREERAEREEKDGQER